MKVMPQICPETRDIYPRSSAFDKGILLETSVYQGEAPSGLRAFLQKRKKAGHSYSRKRNHTTKLEGGAVGQTHHRQTIKKESMVLTWSPTENIDD